MKQRLPTLEKVTHDVLSHMTCTKVLKLNIYSLNPNVQVDIDFTIVLLKKS